MGMNRPLSYGLDVSNTPPTEIHVVILFDPDHWRSLSCHAEEQR